MGLFRFPVHDVFNGFVKVHESSEVEEPVRNSQTPLSGIWVIAFWDDTDSVYCCSLRPPIL